MIISTCEMTPWLVVIFGLVTAGSLNVTDQQTSESNQHDQVAILKQIRKLNNDGSYTFGYEAGDGSFKVETRDVLGNVKGTFGFIDANGEIKRVTYSSSNGTGFKATTISPLQERASVIQSIPLRTNRSSMAGIMKKSNSMGYSTSTESTLSSTTPTKLSVIQAIPNRSSMIKTTVSPSTTTSTTERGGKIFGHYLKNSKSRSRPFTNEQSTQTPTISEEEIITDRYNNDQQQLRTTSHHSHLKTMKHRENYHAKISYDDLLHPNAEKIESRTEKSGGAGSNTFRRQIDERPIIKVHESQEENNSNESSDVYGGQSLSTTRPLFTTTTTTASTTNKPRIIHRYRGESAKVNYAQKFKTTNEDELGPSTFNNDKYENTKVYNRDKFEDESADISSNIYTRDMLPIMSPVESYNDGIAAPQDYIVKESVEPIYIRHRRPDRINKDLPLGVFLTNVPRSMTSEEDNNDVIPIGRQILLRVRRPKQMIYQPAEEKENIEYIAGMQPMAMSVEPQSQPSSPHTASTSTVAATVHPTYIPRKHFDKYVMPQLEPESPQQASILQETPKNPSQQALSHPQREEHKLVRDKDYLREYFYRNVVLPPELPNPITPPLSRRDFQILLRRLLASQYGIRAFDHPRPYLNHALEQDHPNSYHQPSSRYTLVYQDNGDIPVAVSNRYNQKIVLAEPDLPRVVTTAFGVPQDVAYIPNVPYQDPKYVRRLNRYRYYNNENVNSEPASINDDEILPPPIREALLLRMLQLAINNNPQPGLSNAPANGIDTNIPSSTMSKVTTIPIYRKPGPTRSVQIINNNKSDENDEIRNKP